MSQTRQKLHTKFMDGVRIFNKYLFNRITLIFAGGDRGPFSVIHHTGRHSGRAYRTPVLASYVDDQIIIPLSYGEKVDWLRNVLAAGGCEIVRKNERIRAVNPQVIDAADALALLPEERSKVFERFKLEKYLHLQVDQK
jgi:deazaflavin-dependent oxidoreductase (nitroreductase family)